MWLLKERVYTWHFLFIDKRKRILISQLQNFEDFREVERKSGRESCTEKYWASYYFFLNWAMFPPNYAKYRCALLCCNVICGNVNWHHIQIMGQIWHRHLLDNYFYSFQTIFFSRACQQMCTQTTLFTSLGMHMPMFLWFIFAHFPLCFLRVMVMNLLITKHLFPEQKAKKLGPTKQAYPPASECLMERGQLKD